MNYQLIGISFIYLIIFNILVWYQNHAQLIFPKLVQYPILNALPGILIAWGFIQSVKYGYEGFGEAWPLRLSQFAFGTITFWVLTYLHLGESLNIKNGVCLGMAVIIVIIQIT